MNYLQLIPKELVEVISFYLDNTDATLLEITISSENEHVHFHRDCELCSQSLRLNYETLLRVNFPAFAIKDRCLEVRLHGDELRQL